MILSNFRSLVALGFVTLSALSGCAASTESPDDDASERDTPTAEQRAQDESTPSGVEMKTGIQSTKVAGVKTSGDAPKCVGDGCPK